MFGVERGLQTCRHDACSGLHNTRSQRMLLIVPDCLDSVPVLTRQACDHKDSNPCWRTRRQSSIQQSQNRDGKLRVIVFLFVRKVQLHTLCIRLRDLSFHGVDHLCLRKAAIVVHRCLITDAIDVSSSVVTPNSYLLPQENSVVINWR